MKKIILIKFQGALFTVTFILITTEIETIIEYQKVADQCNFCDKLSMKQISTKEKNTYTKVKQNCKLME